MVSGRVGTPLDRALLGQAPLALEKELHAFATALLALWSGIPRHVLRPSVACVGGSRCVPAASRRARPSPLARLPAASGSPSRARSPGPSRTPRPSGGRAP